MLGWEEWRISRKTVQFIDQARIAVKAGRGGDGIAAFRREKYVPAGGPSGGDGGWGGDVVLESDSNLQTLLDFKYKRMFEANDGRRGGPNRSTGASADDLVIRVPCGTEVRDLGSGLLLGDLVEAGERIVIAKGGKGGLGNAHYLSNRNRAPEKFTEGKEGEGRELQLELKLLAEVGLVGMPNAGKSTLISVLSSARPKIADYPFTTLVPNLGVVHRRWHGICRYPRFDCRRRRRCRPRPRLPAPHRTHPATDPPGGLLPGGSHQRCQNPAGGTAGLRPRTAGTAQDSGAE